MAGVLPKAMLFLFISFIVVMINIAICVTAMGVQSGKWNEYRTDALEHKYDIAWTGERPDSGDNVTIGTFAFATSTSFLPYFTLLSTPWLNTFSEEIAAVVLVITGILGTIQLFLLIIIALNFVPKVLGSGVDV